MVKTKRSGNNSRAVSSKSRQNPKGNPGRQFFRLNNPEKWRFLIEPKTIGGRYAMVMYPPGLGYEYASQDFQTPDYAKKWLEDYLRNKYNLFDYPRVKWKTGKEWGTYKAEYIVPKAKNPGRSTEDITEGFHGRPVREEVEILEEEHYNSELAGLGLLVELEILIDEDTVVPIKFKYVSDNVAVLLTCDSDGNIEFTGGDQDLGNPDMLRDRFKLDELHNKLNLGQVDTISYFADKQHLEGPKSQAKGTEYIHKFGEEGGERPTLVYNCRDKKMELVGGDYTVTDEGLRN